MSFKLPVLSSVKVSLRRSTAGLPEFQWSDLSEKDDIGRGAFGSVLISCHGTATEKVVVKKLIAFYFDEVSLLFRRKHTVSLLFQRKHTVGESVRQITSLLTQPQ